jgi:molecular chaperone GrpE
VQHDKPTPDPLDDTAAAALETPANDLRSAEEITRITRERDELKDLLLRKAAEFDNYRKRTERERQSLADTITAGVLEELLPLVDDLERALKVEATSEEGEAYRRGVELILRQLEETLRKRGVRPIEAVGEHFDPNYHQAVSYEPAEGRAEGEIIDEFRRGYMLGDRLLRASMVKVAKG